MKVEIIPKHLFAGVHEDSCLDLSGERPGLARSSVKCWGQLGFRWQGARGAGRKAVRRERGRGLIDRCQGGRP